jgi:para-nitrobenzyl esterase
VRENARRRFGPDADAYLAHYPFTSDAEARRAQANVMRDQTFAWEMRTWARMQAKTGRAKVYLYYFTQVPPLPDAEWLGAQHGAEIPYAFDWPHGAQRVHVHWTDADRQLAERVSSYWVNFAATGDPNGKGLPRWPAYSANQERVFEIGPSIGPVPIPNGAALDMLDKPRQRAEAPTR